MEAELEIGVATVLVAYLFFLYLVVRSLRTIDFIKTSGAKTVREIHRAMNGHGR